MEQDQWAVAQALGREWAAQAWAKVRDAVAWEDSALAPGAVVYVRIAERKLLTNAALHATRLNVQAVAQS